MNIDYSLGDQLIEQQERAYASAVFSQIHSDSVAVFQAAGLPMVGHTISGPEWNRSGRWRRSFRDLWLGELMLLVRDSSNRESQIKIAHVECSLFSVSLLIVQSNGDVRLKMSDVFEFDQLHAGLARALVRLNESKFDDSIGGLGYIKIK